MNTIIDKYEWHVKRLNNVQKASDEDVLVLLELVERLRSETSYFDNAEFRRDVNEWFNILNQYHVHESHELREALFWGALYLFRELKRKEYFINLVIDSNHKTE
ncbi:hypothetical protein OLZ31_26220 [Enterobacter asburiae]|nr:hypothetical protein [Enterobacter asburiae]